MSDKSTFISSLLAVAKEWQKIGLIKGKRERERKKKHSQY